MSLTELHERLSRSPEKTIRYCGRDGKTRSVTFAELHADVAVMVDGLRRCGLSTGDLVGLVGPNCHEWVVADLALLTMGCVSVALPDDREADLGDPGPLLEKYGLAMLLVTRADALGDDPHPAVAVAGDRPPRATARTATGRPDIPEDVFTVAFSSGTSGRKKGLLLTRSGVLNTMTTSGRAWRVGTGDDILVVLPFSNFQQRFLVYTAIWYGFAATVVAPERMFLMMRKLEPTIVLGPPSFFEVLERRIAAESGRGRLPYLLAGVLHALTPRGRGRGLRRRLCRRWTDMYGPRARLLLTGSAPVRPGMLAVFGRAGLPLFEVYGSTECGWIALNTPGDFRHGTSGRPVPGVDVLIAGDGEIVLRPRAPQAVGYVFEGTADAAATFRPDGTLATGDLGRLDRRGFLRLTGRKKNTIITRSGVKISPEELEKELDSDLHDGRTMVYLADDDALLGCVVWLEAWESERRRAEVTARIHDANGGRAPSHRISDIVFRPSGELTVENGLLTRNLKVDRQAVRTALLTKE